MGFITRLFTGGLEEEVKLLKGRVNALELIVKDLPKIRATVSSNEKQLVDHEERISKIENGK